MKQKLNLIITISLLTVGMVLMQSCKEDDPAELLLEALTASDIDLNGATSPSDVPVNPTIVATFSTGLNPTTVTAATVKLIQDYNDTEVEISIAVDDNVVTITPAANLGNGTLHELRFLEGILSDEDQPLGVLNRTFTTAGTFSPAGLIAHWTFEGNANDVVGTFDPPASAIVDITYGASRNTAAGNAATFNGTTSIIEIPNGDQLIETEDFTISFWVKTNSTGHVDANGNPKGHFGMGLGAFYGIQYEVFGNYEGAKFAIRYAAEGGETTAEDMWFPAGATDNTNGGWQGWDYARSIEAADMVALLKDEWLHVTYTYNSESRQGTLYYNGEKMKSFDFDLWPDGDLKRTVTGLTWAGTAPDVVNELAFGFVHSRAGTMWDAEPWGGYGFPTANHFRGQLDDVKFYHKVLTPTEIQLMYDSES
jgi:hypothetical protein